MLSRNKVLILSGTAICTAILIRKYVTEETVGVSKSVSITEPSDPYWQDMLEKQRERTKSRAYIPNDQLAFSRTTSDFRVSPSINGVPLISGPEVLEPGGEAAGAPDWSAWSDVPGFMSLEDLTNNYFTTASELGKAINSKIVHEDLYNCKMALINRVGNLNQKYNLNFGTRWVGDGKQLRIVDVFVDETLWPEQFDTESKTCIQEVLYKISLESALLFDGDIEFPMCLNPIEKKE